MPISGYAVEAAKRKIPVFVVVLETSAGAEKL